MRDFKLCDLELLPADEKTAWTFSHLELLTKRVLSDLGRLLPLLHDLECSELTCRHVCSSQGLMLRLFLQPRLRNLLVSPRKGNTFEIEAARVQSEMFSLGHALRKLARAVRQTNPQTVRPATDLMLELLIRRSRKRWQLRHEGAQTELVFPDSPSELVDTNVHNIEGFVHTISMGGPNFAQKVSLGNAKVHASDSGPACILGLEEIVVYVPRNAERSPALTPWVNRPVCGERWACVARLHRCVLSGSVIGATLAGAPRNDKMAGSR